MLEQQVIDAIKAGVNLIKDIDLKLQIIKLTDDYTELQKMVEQLTSENAELNKQLKRRRELINKNGTYYIKEDGEKLSHPICPKCYLEMGLAFNLARSAYGYAVCTVCNSHYSGSKADFHLPKQKLL